MASSFVTAESGLTEAENNFTVKSINNDATTEQGLTNLESNPEAGTVLMQWAQNVAIDLPQKVLISEDAESRVFLSYNNPEYLKVRHNIQGCDKVIGNISMLLSHLSTAATSK